MNLVLRALCFIGISLVLGTLGAGCFSWQWWAIMLILLIYTILLAIED